MKKSNIITRKKHQEFLEALQDPEHWSPNFMKLSRRIKVSVSTIYDWYKKLKSRERVACHIRIDVFNEPESVKEQYKKWKQNNDMKGHLVNEPLKIAK
jgi:hypothetical protein